MTNQLTDMKHSDVVLIEGGNPAENHPASFKNISEARRRGAKLVTVDPRFSRSAACSDMWVPIRPGTDIAFISGVIHYILENKRYNEAYVSHYTNASWLVDESFKFEDGMFSGFEESPETKGKGRSGKYNKGSWKYQVERTEAWKTGEGQAHAWTQQPGVPRFELPVISKVKTDPSMQHPHCVMQLMRKHFSRYTPEMVSNICGIPLDLFNRAAELISSTYENEKVGSFMYAMGLCQHSVGSQSIRAACMMQLLLGNIGRVGGGVNAMRGECNVQGATDFALLAGELPGYHKLPNVDRGDLDLASYLHNFTSPDGYWSNRAKFIVSMLKEWYGDHANFENDYCFDYWPKADKKDNTHISIFEWMHAGNLEGFFAWGENPAVGGPNSNFEREAMSKLDWMVNVDVWNTETTTFFNHVDGKKAEEIKTEMFFLPACCHYEKQGSVTNTGRAIQWRYKAVEPLSGSHDDGDLLLSLWAEIVRQCEVNPGKFDDPITKLQMRIYMDHEGKFSSQKAAWYINGIDLKTGKLLTSFSQLKADGTTSCANWIYAGYYANEADRFDPSLQNCGRRMTDDVFTGDNIDDGLGLYPNWAFSWPVNRKVLYNRCSCDPEGKPWKRGTQLVEWDSAAAKWKTYDVPDFGTNLGPDKALPFMMTGETVSRLFSSSMAEGPFPEHYEPVESPVKNPISNTQSNPLALVYEQSSKTKDQTPDKYPIISSDFHLVEHWQTGDSTRNQPWLAEIMPRMFVEIPVELAAERGIQNGDWVEIFNERGCIGMNCTVTNRSRPYTINGKTYYSISMPFHWGWSSDVTKGAVRNEITPHYGDGNSSTPEFKAFLCDIRKAVKKDA